MLQGMCRPCCSRTGVVSGELSTVGAKSDVFQNETGYSIQALVDLQKLVLCLAIMESDLEGKPITNSLRSHFKDAVACTDYSSRIILAVRQGAVWKHHGQLRIGVAAVGLGES